MRWNRNLCAMHYGKTNKSKFFCGFLLLTIVKLHTNRDFFSFYADKGRKSGKIKLKNIFCVCN